MYLIVNADDLGMSATVNDAIFELIAARRISSATMMANGPAMREAATQLRRFSSCSFGVHLNLTQFEPLIGGTAARVLINTDGHMTRDIETRTPTMALLRAAFEELCAQVERLAASGIAISHFDSHNHVHTRPHIFPVLKALQKRYGMRKVRIAKNLYGPSQPCSRSLRWTKRVYNAALRHLYRTHTTDGFTELLTFAELSQQHVPPYRSIEVMVHPGAPYAGPEATLLQSDWLPNLTRHVTLINYLQLDR